MSSNNPYPTLRLYTQAHTQELIDQHSGGNKSEWVNRAITRYAAIVQEERPRLARLFTQAEAKEIVDATTDRAYDHDTVALLVISKTKGPHLAEIMRNISLHQRVTLADCCDRYHRRRVQGEPVTPTVEELFR